MLSLSNGAITKGFVTSEGQSHTSTHPTDKWEQHRLWFELCCQELKDGLQCHVICVLLAEYLINKVAASFFLPPASLFSLTLFHL